MNGIMTLAIIAIALSLVTIGVLIVMNLNLRSEFTQVDTHLETNPAN